MHPPIPQVRSFIPWIPALSMSPDPFDEGRLSPQVFRRFNKIVRFWALSFFRSSTKPSFFSGFFFPKSI